MKSTMHRDGTVTYWSVYQQSWIIRSEVTDIPDAEWAAMSESERTRLQKHIDRHAK